ncbi:hypothetical protein D3C79_1099960 [compost metagenome]
MIIFIHNRQALEGKLLLRPVLAYGDDMSRLQLIIVGSRRFAVNGNLTMRQYGLHYVSPGA